MQVSSYEKPDVLKSDSEKAVQSCDWKEFSMPEGRKYRHNAKSMDTTYMDDAHRVRRLRHR